MAGTRYGRRAFVLAGSLAALAPKARAQPAPGEQIARRLLFSPPERTCVTISPDGRKIAFLAPVDGVQNVWVAPVPDPQAGKALTKFADRDLLNRLWWPGDSRHIVFCRDQGGDENWQTQSVDIESGEVRELTPGPGVRSLVQQISARFPGELLVGHNQRDRHYFDIYRVNAATGESALLLQNDGFAEMDPRTSRFRVLYGIRWLSRRRQLGRRKGKR